MNDLLIQAFIYLCAAVIAVPIAKRLGLGSVLGYLIAGVVIGPVTGIVGAETQVLQHYAEFGVVMMLFLVGLELEPQDVVGKCAAGYWGLGGLASTGDHGIGYVGCVSAGDLLERRVGYRIDNRIVFYGYCAANL